VNNEGWVLTSAHLFEEILASDQQASGEAGAQGEERVVAHTEIWALPRTGDERPHLAEARVKPIADLALCRLEGFDPQVMGGTPVFRDNAKHEIEQGASVCRLGFPFYEVGAGWDEERDEFQFDLSTFCAPRFALEGIVARFKRHEIEGQPGSALFIETSTPGLRGQSGGPLLDTTGRICGIQSHTSHIDLGFDASYLSPTGVVVERQFLNVGAATHVDEARALMDEAGVRYRVG
jgi:hypothetical protein